MHYTSFARCKAPTELVSVDAMIGYYPAHKVENHSLHRDKLGGGGERCACSFVVQNHSHHRHEVDGVVTLAPAAGRARSSADIPFF